MSLQKSSSPTNARGSFQPFNQNLVRGLERSTERCPRHSKKEERKIEGMAKRRGDERKRMGWDRVGWKRIEKEGNGKEWEERKENK